VSVLQVLEYDDDFESPLKITSAIGTSARRVKPKKTNAARNDGETSKTETPETEDAVV